VPTNGLVGYWPFNGNANDESGNGNHGTVNGATLTTDKNGVFAKAYNFDGVDDFIQIANSSSLSFSGNNISISFWINVQSFPSGSFNDIIVSKQSGSGSTQSGFNVHQANQTSIGLLVSSGSNAGGPGGTSVISDISNYQNFHNITLIYSNGIASSYLDGQLVNNYSNQTAIIGSNTLPLLFGKANWSNINANPFNGILDEICIYNRLLSQQEIIALYTGIAVCTSPSATITPQGNTTFCQGGSVTLNATTGTNYTYEWYKDGSLINGAGSATYQANLSGNYTVKVIDGACNTTSSSTTVSVLNCASLMENNGDNTSIYPNPIKDMLNIESPFMDGNIILIDANGKTVIEMKIEDKKTKIDVKNIVPGTYNLIIKNKDQIIEKKIVKL
jgi:hypothetical protein